MGRPVSKDGYKVCWSRTCQLEALTCGFRSEFEDRYIENVSAKRYLQRLALAGLNR